MKTNELGQAMPRGSGDVLQKSPVKAFLGSFYLVRGWAKATPDYQQRDLIGLADVVARSMIAPERDSQGNVIKRYHTGGDSYHEHAATADVFSLATHIFGLGAFVQAVRQELAEKKEKKEAENVVRTIGA